MLREKIRFDGQNKSIKLQLGSNLDFVGEQESIDDFIEQETGLSINPVSDGEKFRYIPVVSTEYTFNFFDGVTFDDTLIAAGFTADEITNSDITVLKSFYIVQIYDSNDIDNQNLLHTGYFNGFQFLDVSSDGGQSTRYPSVDSEQEFTNWYIPESFINEQRALGNTSVNVYARFYFFSAKNVTGKSTLRVFLNDNVSDSSTEDKIFQECQIFFDNKTYLITPPSFIETTNIDYIDKLNDSIDTIDRSAPNYPDGDYFTNDGDYDFVDNF